jgi:hypothetical protein
LRHIRSRRLVRSRQLGIRHECQQQRLQVTVLHRGDKLAQRSPQLGDVLLRRRQEVGEIDLALFHLADLVDGELDAIVVAVDQAFDFDEVVLIERLDHVRDVVPHLGVELAGSVGKRELQIQLTRLPRTHLLGGDHERRRDGFVLVLGRVLNVEVFHECSPTPSNQNRAYWGCRLRARGLRQTASSYTRAAGSEIGGRT